MLSTEIELWARSGAMSLTGFRDGPPAVAPGTPARTVAGSLRRVAVATALRTGLVPDLPEVGILGERAAVAGLSRSGPISCGGAFRFLKASDGFFGLSLPRTADFDLLPALIESEVVGDPWEAVQTWAEQQPLADVVERGRLLSLACSAVPSPGSNPDPEPPLKMTFGGSRRQPDRPLVVDLTSLWAGPLCAHLLGLGGADVVKVETWSRPDGARSGPRAFFDLLHAGHRAVALDFESTAGRNKLMDLIARADLVLESSRPRALERFGIHAEEVVAAGTSWLSITAHGRDSHAIGFGDDVAAGAGLVVYADGVPSPCGDALADPLAGVVAAAEAAEALNSPRARLIDVSMHGVAAAAAYGCVEPHTVIEHNGSWWVETAQGRHQVLPPQARTPSGSAHDSGADNAEVLGMTTLVRGVEVDGSEVDVRLGEATILEIGSGLSAQGAEVVHGNGGALLPGLHDHHLHLLALAASYESLDCSRTTTLAELAELIASSTATWCRVIGYDEARLGRLDRSVLDPITGDRPVRIQHRSGALWILNSAALRLVESELDGSGDVELDAAGQPNGRLWRYDERLRAALPPQAPELAPVGRQLSEFGITRVTDATPDLDAHAISLLVEAVASRVLPAHLTLLGAPDGALPDGVTAGPQKILLRDHDLPAFEDLCGMIAAARRSDRAVAVHCVSRESLVLTLAALDEVSPRAGDRIEHASVVPHDLLPRLVRLGVAVVTQPGFLRTRGEDYRRDLAADDLACLYPYATLLSHGIATSASSDAPFGDLDPWATIRSARDRTTASGLVLGPYEGVSPRTALLGYLGDLPGGAPRKIAVGQPADTVLLHVPLVQALKEPDSSFVCRTFRGG